LTAASNGSDSARTAITSTDLPNVQKDEDHVTDQIGANGVVQSTLESTGNSETQVGTTISTQISNGTSANLSQVLSKLSQTQTAYQAALESGVYTMNLSILNYLG
jgi:flagellar hook-associated protein 3 FlgL